MNDGNHEQGNYKIQQSSIYYDGLLGRWDKQLINQASDVSSITSFFIISCKILSKNRFNLFSYNFTKIKIKSFECPNSIRNYEKNNAWNISEPAFYI
jgi:hypothetical protein